MAKVDLSKKYSNFIAPKNQITVNNQDINQKHGITTSTLTVEQTTDTSKFTFLIDDAQAKWINTALFEPNKTVEVKMGYGVVLENVAIGEITTVKSIFSANRGPQIEVCGEGKLHKSTTLTTMGSPVCSLTYGKTLLSFTAVATAENQPPKTPVNRTVPTNASTTRLRCSAECIGLPDIRNGVVVALTGLGRKFNQNYLVEKATHSWDNSFGYRTRFEAGT